MYDRPSIVAYLEAYAAKLPRGRNRVMVQALAQDVRGKLDLDHRGAASPCPVAGLIEEAARIGGITAAALHPAAGRKLPNVVRLRFAIAHVAKERFRLSAAEIARRMGYRDHSAVRNGLDQASNWLRRKDGEFARLVEQLLNANPRCRACGESLI